MSIDQTNNETKDWEHAISIETAEAYLQFSEKYPKSILADIAKKKVAEFNDSNNYNIFIYAILKILEITKKIGDYWFREYNPLYFISAACVLYGILLISSDFSNNIAIAIQFSLFLVITLYQLSLIGSAKLLIWAPEQKRSAVFLGFLAVIFIFDPTFTLETFYRINRSIFLLSIWWFLATIQYILLGTVFTLRNALYLYIVSVLYLFLITFMPWLYGNLGIEHNTFYIMFSWIGMFLWISRYLFTPAQYTIPISDEYKFLADRSLKSLWTLQFGLFNYHIIPIFFIFNNRDISVTYERWMAILPLVVIFVLLYLRDNLLNINISKLKIIKLLISFVGLYIVFKYPKLTTLNSAGAAISISLAIFGQSLPVNYTPVVLGFLYISFWTWGWESWPLPYYPSIYINVLFLSIFAIFGFWRRQVWVLIAVVSAILWELRYIIKTTIKFIVNLFAAIINFLKHIFVFIGDILVSLWEIIFNILNFIFEFPKIIINGIVYLFSNFSELPTKYQGSILLIIGFVALGTGVFINLRQSRRPTHDKAARG